MARRASAGCCGCRCPSPVKAVETATGSTHPAGARHQPGRIAGRAARRLRRRGGRRAGARSRCGRETSSTPLRDRVAGELVPTTVDIVGRVEKVLTALHEVRARAAGRADRRAGRGDRRHPRATGAAAAHRLRHRHRRGASRRSDPLPDRHRPAPGAAAARRSAPTASGWSACTPSRTPTTNWCRHCHRPGRPPTTSATSPGMIEELRVSLWAQQLGTAAPGQRAADLPRDRRHPRLGPIWFRSGDRALVFALVQEWSGHRAVVVGG